MDISLNGTFSETDRSESSACTASASFEELQVEDAPVAHNNIMDSDSESEHSSIACCSPVCLIATVTTMASCCQLYA
jgi:hypothetical protein